MLNIISSAIDTLELTYGKTRISYPVMEALVDAKADAALNNNRRSEVVFGSHRFHVLSHGAGFFQYLLNGVHFDLKICVSEKMSMIGVRVKSISIYELGIHKVLEELAGVVADLRGDPSERRATVKRLDICVDFQGWEPKLSDLKHFVCKAKKRGVYLEPDEPNYFRFGKNEMVVRLYNKGEEIRHSNKLWMIDVWKQNPHFNPEKPIWRLEVQLRRQALKNLNVDYTSEALEQLSGIWVYGLEWLELKKPTKNKQKSRWPTDPRWVDLRRNAGFVGKPCEPVRAKKRAVDEERIVRMFGAYTSSFAAIRGYENMELGEVIYRAGVLYHNQLEAKGLDFSEVVRGKMNPDSGFPF
ncbi:MAG: hypothetical protein Q8J63_04170 [Candidatus Aquicultor sp.]|nr:hypothetical protein [Candidatus Aquicultor sp.]